MTTVGDVLELVRAPAALTVIGDTMVGGYAGGGRLAGRRWLLPLASVFLYSGGMALNDYADRRLDAVERPERPIPSGRISPRRALGVAVAVRPRHRRTCHSTRSRGRPRLQRGEVVRRRWCGSQA
ncbi:UbiA family prenyltransferase, partial [Agromyces humi]|uniref:UbiA family prenyltransferase n=1 Tax=Agromyces humi TaxID=1766800 RepID=UPI001F25F953